jgi:hypothetical protein
MSRKSIDICQNEEGNSPENPKDWAATIWHDLIKGPTGREVWNGVKSDVAVLTRGQNVNDCSSVSLNRMQQAWASTGDVYEN